MPNYENMPSAILHARCHGSALHILPRADWSGTTIPTVGGLVCHRWTRLPVLVHCIPYLGFTAKMNLTPTLARSLRTRISSPLRHLLPVALGAWVLLLPVHALLPNSTAIQLSDAIWRSEGGPRARVPFGILSVPVSGYWQARRVCLNTIQNMHDRWIEAGRPGQFIDFLGDRYCERPNSDWKRNVKKHYKICQNKKHN